MPKGYEDMILAPARFAMLDESRLRRLLFLRDRAQGVGRRPVFWVVTFGLGLSIDRSDTARRKS